MWLQNQLKMLLSLFGENNHGNVRCALVPSRFGVKIPHFSIYDSINVVCGKDIKGQYGHHIYYE